MCIVGSCAYHDVRLMGISAQNEVAWNVRQGRGTSAYGRCIWCDVAGKLPDCICNFPERDISQDEKYHVAGLVSVACKAQCVFRAESSEQFRFPEDISSQRMVREYQLLEIVEYKFGRAVFVALYFVYYDFHFLFNLVFRKCAVEYNIGQEFGGTCEMLSQKGAIYNCLFLVGVGIEIAAYVFHTVEYVPCAAVCGALEQEMFHKVGYPLFVVFFVACACVYGVSAIDYVGWARTVYYPQSVSKCICRYCVHF